MWWSWWHACNQMHEHVGQVPILIVMTALAVLWFAWTNKKSRKASPRLPPGPWGLPIVGYLPYLGTDLHKEFTQLAKIYGPIYKLWLGSKLCMVVSSPSLVKEVVRDHDLTFTNRDPPIAGKIVTYGGNDIVFQAYGSVWMKLRKIFVSQMLGNSVLDGLYSLRREQVKNSIRQVYGKAGTPVDVSKLAFLTAFNASLSMFWGGSLQQDQADYGAQLRNAATEIMVLIGSPNISDIFPPLAWFDIQGIEKQMKALFGIFDRIFDSAIEQRKKIMAAAKAEDRQPQRNEERKDFLQFLLDLNENENSATSITIAQLKGMLMVIVVGGTDTTSTMVEWTIAELIQHPDIMHKVREELIQVVGLNNWVEEFHLPKLTYLNAVIKETCRLHPALPLLVPRCPSDSRTVGGYLVPKGTRIFINAWSIHRDPSVWDNPLEFMPERVLNDPSKFDFYGNSFEYLPFGSGRRMCAGLPLGERMLIYILASFLHCFEWKMPVGVKLELSDKFGIVTKKMVPLVAVPTPRLPNLELYA
ncbi:hypothetical protein FNV43_RR09117 [Rhamnella rubrinervis]|uniref:Cytochrome P450 n=1 Tax=Rhamnella rubrinervis TaxID=2594499 RepID=A0A8K0HA37_9ROSA|nr:hypothetical protein FNV43_RR09117 [Rhamnella rubrinervis]